MKRSAQICLMAFILILSLPLAAAEKKRPSSDRLKDYRATGKIQNCLARFMIARTEILNDYTILFHMHNRKVFKNELPYRCIRLGSEKRFSYTLTSALLCDDTIITVFSLSGPISSCGLGEFEELEKIEKTGTPEPGGLFMNRS